MNNSHHNPNIKPYMQIIDYDNGERYSDNITKTGMFIKYPESNTSMFYEVKRIQNVKIVFIRYIHYENKRELLNLLAFAAQWWMKLKPNMVYFIEKERRGGVGSILVKEMGFNKQEIDVDFKPFNCKKDGGWPCSCKVYEYTIYGITKKKNNSIGKSKRGNEINTIV